MIPRLQPEIMKRSIPVPECGCWIWLNVVCAKGYGVANFVETKKQRAHRVSYLAFRGEIPEGLFVCHTCDIRCCVNPDHLFIGTNTDNMRDCAAKGRIVAQRGEDHNYAKLTAKDIPLIRASTLSQEAIGKQFGVSQRCVSDIKSGKTWRHIPWPQN